MKFRHGKDKFNDTPGVGTYDIDKRHRGGISMGFRHEAGKKDVFPGPGAYNDQSGNIMPKAPAYSMSFRNLRERNELAHVPGPNAYSPNHDATRRSAPAFSMSHRHPLKGQEVTPGPGHYNQPFWAVSE